MPCRCSRIGSWKCWQPIRTKADFLSLVSQDLMAVRLEYHTFARSFESLVESRTSISTERLYYLEQYTAGEVKELISSCHRSPPDKGYRVAHRLIKKRFGDEYRVASAYESKAVNWPSIKPGDGTALSRLDNIMELQKRLVKFDDVITFVSHEARIATNPVLGKISVDTKVATDTRPCRGSQKTVHKTDKLSFAAHVDNTPDAETGTKSSTTSNDPIGTPSSDGITCPFCNFRHELEVCRFLRRRPHQERIQFLSSEGLCFGFRN